LEAKSHNSITASKFSPSLGIRKTGAEVVAVVATVVEEVDIGGVVVLEEDFSISDVLEVEEQAELIAKTPKITQNKKM